MFHMTPSESWALGRREHRAEDLKAGHGMLLSKQTPPAAGQNFQGFLVCVCVGVNTVVKYVLSMCEPLIPISSAPTHNTHRAWAIQDVIEAVKERGKDMI